MDERPSPVAAVPGPAWRVLLADDDDVTRALTTEILRRSGHEVVAVGDGAAALERLAAEHFPILVADWDLPALDGPALCRELRRLPAPAYTYAILLVSAEPRERAVEALEAGADDYLTRPVHAAELTARLKAAERLLALERSLRQANELNHLLSITDPLTGAYNRRRLMQRLPVEIERARRYARPLAVLMCDLDGFKAVNDRHGHAVGDQVLQAFVATAASELRVDLDWIARYGGEEFAIVLPETGPEAALACAERIRAALALRPLPTSAGPVPITVSIGVAGSEAVGEGEEPGAERWLEQSDAALYRAKAAGRNRAVLESFAGTAGTAAH